MGIVWRAVDERLARSVAVKQILTQPGLTDEERLTVRQRAMREAKNAARFQHPNAIIVFDIAEHDGEPMLVMEYLPSQSLSDLLAERGTMPVREVARVGEQVASALLAAHRAGIVHRDIKPGNILIDDTGTAKITDFGISRATGDHTLTQTGLIGGTPAYLAPELARGDDPTPSSDVFSLGATLYHAIEGVPAYGDSTNQLALLYSAANGKINPPQQAGVATALLMSLLRPDPAERPSMYEARERLAALAGAAGEDPAVTRVAPPLPTAAPAAPPPWQRGQQATPPPTRTSHYPTPKPRPNNDRDNNRDNTARPARDPQQRKMIAALAAAVVVVAAVVAIVLNMGGDDDGGNPNAGTQPTNQQSSPPSSSSGRAEGTQTPSDGNMLGWGAAGEFVLSYYNNPAGSWDKLTPAVQAKFGSPAEYASYWQQNAVDGSENIEAYKHANNDDGSVDMRAKVNFESGPEQVTLRVISSGGKMLIDSDPRSADDRTA